MSLNKTLKALSDPNRREILKVLRKKPLTVQEITEQIKGVSFASVSKHLAVLKEAELVSYQRVGTFMLYELNTTIFGDILTYVKEFQGEMQNVANKESSLDLVVRSRA
jgi:DNA-binding transcriptional ArsR family regulator